MMKIAKNSKFEHYLREHLLLFPSVTDSDLEEVGWISQETTSIFPQIILERSSSAPLNRVIFQIQASKLYIVDAISSPQPSASNFLLPIKYPIVLASPSSFLPAKFIFFWIVDAR